MAALRVTTLRDALWSAATYALAIAIGAAALRAMEIPRLLGPALLTLEFYLWDAFHGASSRRRDSRWAWQTALLIGLGVIVILWNQQASAHRLQLPPRAAVDARPERRDAILAGFAPSGAS